MLNATHPKKHAIVYIDGFNLYYGIRQAFGGKYKWLDLQGLCESFMRPGYELVAVKYFTSIVKETAAQKRQEIYIKAFEHHCPNLRIFYGHLVKKPIKCPHCNKWHQTYEEKQTDVNIACEMISDAYLDHYDHCYLVSGDSDLVPPLKIIRRNLPDKDTTIACPPKRKSIELNQTAHRYFDIYAQRLGHHQLPETITLKSGKSLYRPPL